MIEMKEGTNYSKLKKKCFLDLSAVMHQYDFSEVSRTDRYKLQPLAD